MALGDAGHTGAPSSSFRGSTSQYSETGSFWRFASDEPWESVALRFMFVAIKLDEAARDRGDRLTLSTDD